MIPLTNPDLNELIHSENMSFGGWSVERFTQSVEDYVCAICREVYKDAVSINCGHTFCQRCMEQSLRTNGNCPTCRVRVEMMVPSFYIRTMIDSLLVQCLYHDKGCSTVLPLSEVIEHQEKCNFQSVPCKKCGEMVDFDKEELHQVAECPQRVLICDLCHDSYPFYKKEAHELSCSHVTISCLYCPWTGVRGSHHELVCDMMPMPCTFIKYGCSDLIRRRDLMDHEELPHTELLCRVLDKSMRDTERNKYAQLQEGPFRVRGHVHRVNLVSDLSHHACAFCNKRIKVFQHKYIGYHCSHGCNYSVCIDCLGTHRLYKSRMNMSDSILLNV